MAKRQEQFVARWVRTAFYNEKTKKREEIAVYIEVDFEDIAKELASKAFHNKSHQAVEVRGAVTVTYHEDDQEKKPPLPVKAEEMNPVLRELTLGSD